jgi:co-chaperonin GroES (HSP10)
LSNQAVQQSLDFANVDQTTANVLDNAKAGTIQDWSKASQGFQYQAGGQLSGGLAGWAGSYPWDGSYTYSVPNQVVNLPSIWNVPVKEQFNRLDPNDPVFGSHANDSGIEPQGWKILIAMELEAEITRAQDAGVVIPEQAESRYTAAAMVGKVVQIGKGCYRSDRYPEGPWCKVGDYIAMAPYCGTRIYSKALNKDFRLINEDSVDAVVIGPEVVDKGRL